MLFFCQRHYAVGIGHAHGHRLFNNDMYAMLNAVQGNFRMETALCRDRYENRLLLIQHLFIVRIPVDGAILLQAMLCQHCLHMFRHNVTDGCNLQMVGDCRLDMVGGYTAAAD